ncbi:MAG: GNAT family N-acetyltransferase [Opitutus sp.]|nr:GNAT family N-acetyltransferase [Opitutus sp.]
MKRDQALTIEAATPADVPAIATLLREAGLPHEDFSPHVANFLVARDAPGAVVGAVGAERGGDEALLRSLVVVPDRRGAGLGGRLVDELERRAASWGVRRWWLLTTTAEKFFAARGFRVAARSAAPEVMRATGQFSGGCSRSAVCMMRECAGGAT